MSDEERIEQLELEVKVLQANNKGLKDKIDEQSKEIEELRNEVMEKELIVDGMKEDRRIAVEEILEQYYVSKDKIKAEIEELENADLTTVYLNGVYDGEKKVQDKIKAKIEEVCESTIEESNVDILYSLLEKE